MSEAQKQGTEPYGYRRTLDLPFEEAIERTREELGKVGFGVLTEIDIKDKLNEKLGVDFRRYVILGACNPPIAYEALQADIEIGLLLPCNVIVYEDDGKTVVNAIDAAKMLSVAGHAELEESAATVNGKLRAAIDSI